MAKPVLFALASPHTVRHTGVVPDFCTCGAQLPPDARFCHKCGKPQREEPVIEEAEKEAAPTSQPDVQAPATVPTPVLIGFRNSLAVRVGFFAAVMSSLMIQVIAIGFPFWLVGAGFGCVYLYQRRTGEALSVGGGARMGWITGLFSFAMFIVQFTLAVVIQLHTGEFYRQLEQSPYFQAGSAQAKQLLQNPLMLAFGLLFVLVVAFIVIAMLSVAGGALGAKMLRKEGMPSA